MFVDNKVQESSASPASEIPTSRIVTLEDNNDSEDSSEKQKAPTVSEILSDPVLKTNLYTSCVLWMCNSFNFFLLTFFLKYFPGNMFYNGLCFAVADITAFAVAGCTINYTGVR